MKLQLLDLAIATSGTLVLAASVWYTVVTPMVRKELVTVTPTLPVKEEEKVYGWKDLMEVHPNTARVAEYIKMCAMKNRKVLPGDYTKYCINCGETIKVA